MIRVGDYSAITPLGADWKSTWRALIAGTPSTRTRPSWPFDVDLPLPVCSVAGLPRNVGAEGASSRLLSGVVDGLRVPHSARLYIGTAHGESDVLLSTLRAELAGERPQLSLWKSLVFEPLLDRLSSVSESLITYSACTAGMHALVSANADLRTGRVDSAVVVGVDALSVLGIAGFVRSGAMTVDPCIPFTKERRGTVVGEGAAAIILHGDAYEKSASSNVAVSLLGVGMSCDAGHPTLPDPKGRGVEEAWRDALGRAGTPPEAVGAVVLHGSGTVANDAAEALAYERVFHRMRPPATAIKGLIGHTMGACGLHNCLVAIESARTGLLPPATRSKYESDFLIPLVRGASRRINRMAPILASCSGFGGNNVAAIFRSEA